MSDAEAEVRRAYPESRLVTLGGLHSRYAVVRKLPALSTDRVTASMFLGFGPTPESAWANAVARPATPDPASISAMLAEDIP